MKKSIFTLLLLLPLRVLAQDTLATDTAVAAAPVPAPVIPENKYFVPVDTLYRTDPETGEKIIKGYKPKTTAEVYKLAIAAYDSGQYAACHQYCWNEIRQPGRLKGKQAADVYALAMKSSYYNHQYSSALIYYQDMRRANLHYDKELTKLAIFSYFPTYALQHQEHFTIYEKDTAFMLRLAGEMIRKDPRWLMIRSKMYGAIADIDELEPELRAAYRQRREADLATYAKQCDPEDWKELLQ